MQHESANAYEEEAAYYRRLGDNHEQLGNHRTADDYRKMADDCDRWAQQIRNGGGN